MGTIKRAFLYIIRKRGKSILLFCVMFIMATFVLTGISIERSAEAEQKNLRQTFGGEFLLSPIYSEENPYLKVIKDDEGNSSIYTERPLTQELVESVAKVKGIKGCSAETYLLVQPNLEIFQGNVPLKGNLNYMVYARTVYSTASNSFFTSKEIKLTEGRHITSSENKSAIISKNLADLNDLKLGDKISLCSYEDAVEVEIIGIYEILKYDTIFENVPTYEKRENQIFIDYNTLQSLFHSTPIGFTESVFTVDDPEQLNSIVAEVRKLDIDWQAFSISTDNNRYLEAAEPLKKLQSLVTSMILIIALVSSVILALILTMWGRMRIHETGILLSLGIKKINIIGQYLAEVLMIAVIAFGLSFFSGNAIAGKLGNELLSQNAISDNIQNSNITYEIKDGFDDVDIDVSFKNDIDIDVDANANIDAADVAFDIDVSEMDVDIEVEDTEQLNIAVKITDMLFLYIIGFAVIIISVIISSIMVMRLKPCQILSKMS